MIDQLLRQIEALKQQFREADARNRELTAQNTRLIERIVAFRVAMEKLNG